MGAGGFFRGVGGLSADEAFARVGQYAASEPEEAFPEGVAFVDAETSWSVFVMMEAFDWRVLPYPGGLLDQPDWLVGDLMTWRRLAGIAERQVSKDKKES